MVRSTSVSVSEMEKESDMDRWWVPLSKDKAEANTDCEEEGVIQTHLVYREENQNTQLPLQQASFSLLVLWRGFGAPFLWKACRV